MTKKIELLLARRFRSIECSVFSKQSLQLPIMLSVFVELLESARKRIEQGQLSFGRKQRLVIVRPMEIDKFISEIFEDRQCRWRSIDELARATGSREAPFNDKLVLAWLDPSFHELRIELLQILSGKNGFHRAKICTGANKRLIRAFTEQKLQRPDDDRFACPSLSGDGDKSGAHLPLKFFHQSEIFYSQ